MHTTTYLDFRKSRSIPGGLSSFPGISISLMVIAETGPRSLPKNNGPVGAAK